MPDIVAFTEAHISGALELWHAEEHIGLSSADEPAALARFLRRNPGTSFAALDGDRLAGAVLCGHDGRRGYVHHLAVAAAHRRSGLGSDLLGACLDALRGLGIEKCHAFVVRDNPMAELFWERSGWTRRDELELYSAEL